MTYIPKPIDTSNIELPEAIKPLIERLAENNHDLWTQKRLEEGWRFGDQRDGVAKTHPCLVPYDQLPESEKAYDREMAVQSIKAIIAAGSTVEGTPELVKLIAGDAYEINPAERWLERIEQCRESGRDLLAIWNERHQPDSRWTDRLEVYRKLAEHLLKLGFPTPTNDIVNEGLDKWPHDERLGQLHGLAQARLGATERANRILTELKERGNSNEETIGTLARTHKDLAMFAADDRERQAHLRKAFEFYHSAYVDSHGTSYWTGINAATLALLAGDAPRAQDLARALYGYCVNVADQPGAPGYYLLATLGESALILGDLETAEHWYRRAYAAGSKRFGDLQSTRRQAKLLLEHFGKPQSLIDKWMPMPRVVVFAGHMIDQEGRESERFPLRLQDSVAQTIRQWLQEQHALIGFSSAACGSDILFLEQLLELQGAAHIVLPFPEAEFIKESVAVAPGGWQERFDRVVDLATQVVYASPERTQTGAVSYDYANLMLHGLAATRARELDSTLLGLVVWDGRSGDGPGGTANIVHDWHELNVPVHRIDISTIPQETVRLPITTAPPTPESRPVESEDCKTKVMTMLFADAVGYSKLTDEQVPLFIQHFLGAIADLKARHDRTARAAVVSNTWGDGLYLVFEMVEDAGRFALDLCDLVTSIDWGAKRLPESLSMRIALHSGPVYESVDPITGRLNYTGSHVSRAARIEPITPPGQVYASQAFAALVERKRIKEFACHLIKQAPWAKQYGTFPTYVVRRKK